MLKTLRLRLTLLYLISAIVLALSIGGGTYSLINYYFRTTNDQALKVKMGLQFAAFDIPLPLDLYEAVRQAGLVITKEPALSTDTEEKNESSDSIDEEEHEEGLQESELADIYVLPLTLDGQLVSNFDIQLAKDQVNSEAVLAAVQQGYDLRSTTTPRGIPVRILTYLVPENDKVQVFQIGRYLTTQQQVLKQLLSTMILLGGLVTILFGFASWVMSGRTIRPSQLAWDKQQTFIANASHELRTPLTLIHAGVELSLRKAKSDDQRELLTDVLSDADYMKKLIEDLLCLSRLDARALKMDIQTVTLLEFIPEILRQVQRLAESKNISLNQKFQDVKILADPVKLKQILLVVLDNAIRNNQHGGSIQVEVYEENQTGAVLISDTGSGIPGEYIDKIFDRFYKVNDQSTSEYRGSGLGLSIAKGLVEAQNGNISITSLQGKGTQVKLAFPLSS